MNAEMNETELCDVDIYIKSGLSPVKEKSDIMDGNEFNQKIVLVLGIILVPIMTWLLIKLTKGKIKFLLDHSWIGNGTEVNCTHNCKLNIKRVCKNLEERIDKIEASIEPINKNLGLLLERITSIENSIKTAVDEVIAKKRKIIITEVMETIKDNVCNEVQKNQQTIVKDIKVNEPKGNLKSLLHQILNIEETKRINSQNNKYTNTTFTPLEKREKSNLSTISIKCLKEALIKIRSHSESMQNIHERHAEFRQLNRSPLLLNFPTVPCFRPSLIANCKPFPITYKQI